jgi:hypothetical protein
MSQIQVRMSLAPGLGPWGAKAPDRTGQGRVDVVFHAHPGLTSACGGKGEGEVR